MRGHSDRKFAVDLLATPTVFAPMPDTGTKPVDFPFTVSRGNPEVVQIHFRTVTMTRSSR